MALFFKEHTVSFRSSQPEEKIMNMVKDHLDSLGRSEISADGKIFIDTKKYDTFLYEGKAYGDIAKSDDKYTITLNWDTKVKWVLAILVVVCTCGLGMLLVMFMVLQPSARVSALCVLALEKIQRDVATLG